MWMADAMQQWEDINAPDPYEKQLIEAAHSLEVVLIYLSKVQENLDDAWAEFDEDCPMSDRLLSFYDDIDGIKAAIRDMKENWERGHRG